MGEHHSYIRIMSDIIDSGIWAKLSSAARTLYPVLLKFSDYNFKPVWPNTETLLGLTGFSTKKSLNEAKRDLERHGLLHVIPGSGRTSTRYYFRFDYPGSKITPLGDPQIPLREGQPHPSGVENRTQEGGIPGLPNHINITIHNNQTNHTKASESEERRNPKSRNWAQENMLKNKHANSQFYSERISWSHFLDWVDRKLSSSSAREFHRLEVSLDGEVLYIHSPVTPIQKNTIESFFRKESDLSLVFASPKAENRIF